MGLWDFVLYISLIVLGLGVITTLFYLDSGKSKKTEDMMKKIRASDFIVLNRTSRTLVVTVSNDRLVFEGYLTPLYEVKSLRLNDGFTLSMKAVEKTKDYIIQHGVIEVEDGIYRPAVKVNDDIYIKYPVSVYLEFIVVREEEENFFTDCIPDVISRYADFLNDKDREEEFRWNKFIHPKQF